MVASHLDYCSSVLFLLNIGQISKLQKVQNRCMRLILKVKWDTSRLAMLEALKFHSVRQWIYFNTLKFIHKIVAGNAPDYMKKYLTKRKEKHDYDLRRKSDFDRPQFRKRTTQNSLLFKGLCTLTMIVFTLLYFWCIFFL